MSGLLAVVAPSAFAADIRVRLEASAEGPGYRNGSEAPVRSVAAEIEDLGECRVLTVCISDVPKMSCEAARRMKPTGPSFVLMVGVRLGRLGTPRPASGRMSA